MQALERVQNVLAVIQPTVTIAAIMAAGVWFLARGEAASRANISHVVAHRQMSDEWTWIGLVVSIRNEGNQRLDLAKATARVQQILPLDPTLAERLAREQHLVRKGETRIIWPRIGASYEVMLSNRIEPNETDNLSYDFVVPSSVETVRLYSYIEQQADPPLGWQNATIYDLEEREEDHP